MRRSFDRSCGIALVLGGVLTLGGALAAGCDPTPLPRRCASSADCGGGRVCVDGACVEGTDAAGLDGGGDGERDARIAVPVSIAITPADAVLTVGDGALPTVDLDVVATYDDGSTLTITGAFWTGDAPTVALVERTTGVVTPSGVRAGVVGVHVEALGLAADGSVRVRVERSDYGPGLTPDVVDRFAGAPVADPARAAAVLYPLEGTVFPENVYPADVQWEGGEAGDVYRVRLETDGVLIRGYALHDGSAFGYHWLPPRDLWRAVAESAPEAPVTVAVDRLVAATGEVIEGAARTVRFADAVIRGSIYYWDLGGGRVVRIAGDGSGRESFMPNPPARARDGRRCVACHTVSFNGRRMAAELWDGGDFSTVFDLTADLTTDPAPTVFGTDTVRFLTASFNPDASRLVANNANELFLVDGNTGARLPAGGAGLPSAQAANPAWSPDGTAVAYVSNTDGTWAVDYSRGDLSVIDAMPGDAFGPPRTLLTGAPRVVARPSWSPNSAWIAYQYGAYSRAFRDFGTYHERRDAVLELVSRDGATRLELARLNDGAANSYYPTFSPFDEGGYFWLAFFSTRDYGNAQVGTRGTERRQLWVAAVDSTPTAGEDPSFTPYWLPQQDVSHENMAAFWAAEACRADGRGCAASAECCNGFCRDTGSGPVCVPPESVECSREGESCRSDSDCCASDGTRCVGNVCSTLG